MEEHGVECHLDVSGWLNLEDHLCAGLFCKPAQKILEPPTVLAPRVSMGAASNFEMVGLGKSLHSTCYDATYSILRMPSERRARRS
jgi:hypothetical protein